MDEKKKQKRAKKARRNQGTIGKQKLSSKKQKDTFRYILRILKFKHRQSLILNRAEKKLQQQLSQQRHREISQLQANLQVLDQQALEHGNLQAQINDYLVQA